MAEEQRKVIIVQNGNSEKKPHRLTWGKYAHYINVYKYWVLGATLVGAIGGFLGLKYVYNRPRENITTDISLSLALHHSDDDTNPKTTYLNGISFNYTDIIDSSHFQAVIESNDEYRKLDATTLTQKNAVSIAPRYDSKGLPLADQYTLTTYVEYFSNETQARDFIRDLLDYQVKVASEAIDQYYLDNFLPLSLTVYQRLSVSEMVGIMTKQYNTLNTTYDTLVSDFGGSLRIGNMTLSDYRKEFDAKLSGTYINALYGQQTNNRYVNFNGDVAEAEKAMDSYENQAASYFEQYKTAKKQRDSKAETLANLVSVKTPTEEISALIITLGDDIMAADVRIKELEETLGAIGYDIKDNGLVRRTGDQTSYLSHLTQYVDHYDDGSEDWSEAKQWYDDSTVFRGNLDVVYNSLRNAYDQCNTVTREVYKTNYNTITVAQTNMGVLNNHISSALGAVAGGLVLFAASSLICAGYGISKEAKNGGKAVQETAAEEESEAKAADKPNEEESK